MTAGTFILVRKRLQNLEIIMDMTMTIMVEAALGYNGDDAIELFYNSTAIDVFGDINTDGSGYWIIYRWMGIQKEWLTNYNCI